VQTPGELRMRGTANWWAGLLVCVYSLSLGGKTHWIYPPLPLIIWNLHFIKGPNLCSHHNITVSHRQCYKQLCFFKVFLTVSLPPLSPSSPSIYLSLSHPSRSCWRGSVAVLWPHPQWPNSGGGPESGGAGTKETLSPKPMEPTRGKYYMHCTISCLILTMTTVLYTK
jgi:hypothetical protein